MSIIFIVFSYKIGYSEKLIILTRLVCFHHKFEPLDMHLEYQGVRVDEETTPAELGMEQYDLLEIVMDESDVINLFVRDLTLGSHNNTEGP